MSLNSDKGLLWLNTHQELEERHGGRKLKWHKIFVSIKTIPYSDESTENPIPPGFGRRSTWLLALCADEKTDKIGRSFDMNSRFDVVKGEVFLGYEAI